MHIIYDNINNYSTNNFKNFYSILSESEKEKFNKLIKDNDKKLLLLSRYLLKQLIEQNTNFIYDNTSIKYNENGKPMIENISYNISHSNEYCAVAVSNNQIGIDIEKIRTIDLKIMDIFCTESEKKYIINSDNPYKSFFEIYCLKEAYFKMLGTNLKNLKDIEFSFGSTISSNSKQNITITLNYDITNYIIAIIENNNYV